MVLTRRKNERLTKQVYLAEVKGNGGKERPRYTSIVKNIIFNL